MYLHIICLLYLIIISFFDLRTGHIPNLFTFGFLILMFVIDVVTNPKIIPAHLICAVFFFLLFYGVSYFTKGLGIGDVKLAAVLGYYLGFFKTSFVFISACFIGVMFFLIGHIVKKRLKTIPFAPFVAAGYIASEVVCRRFL